MAIYTDGSFCPTTILGGGGIALVRNGSIVSGESTPFGIIHSIFEAERLEIFRVFEFIDANITKSMGAATIYILTDSQSPISYLSNKHIPNSPYQYKLFRRHMFDFWKRTGIALNFGFVRGHSGGDGEESADKLANKGRHLSGKTPY